MRGGKKRARARRKSKATRSPSRSATRPSTRPAEATKTAEGPASRLIQPWFDRYPGRLEWELQALRAAGIEFHLDEDARGHNRVVIHLVAHVAGHDIRLIAVFPDSYPELRFELYGPELNLPKHQNIIGKNLCLLDQNTAAWEVDDNLAAFVTERLPLVLRAVWEPGSVYEVEQGEPVSIYFPYADDSVMVVPEFALNLPNLAERGYLQFRLQSGNVGRPIRAVISDVLDHDSRSLRRSASRHPGGFNGPILSGRWVRLEQAPQTGDPDALVDMASRKLEALRKPHWQRVEGWKFDVVGIIFPEEIAAGRTEDGWLFVVRETGRSYFSRPQRFSEEQLLARIPHLRYMRSQVVGVVGLGGLGGPSALELSRSMTGELRLLDHDFVEAGATVRWPLGLAVVGTSKAKVLCEQIALHYPLTEVKGYNFRLGTAQPGLRGPCELDVLSEFLDGLTLIYDASAEIGVQHLLSNLARSLRIPQIFVSATEGLWGGIITRCIPGQTGCWLCFKLRQRDGSIPVPPGNPADTVQPRGCGRATFAGSGFDLLPLVAQGVRLAVQTLGQSPVGQKADMDSRDVYVLRLRDEAGKNATPEWQAFDLTPHPNCQHCGEGS